jgi:hypothetical protein
MGFFLYQQWLIKKSHFRNLSSSVYVFAKKKKVHNIDNYDAIQITPNNLLGVLVGPITRLIIIKKSLNIYLMS